MQPAYYYDGIHTNLPWPLSSTLDYYQSFQLARNHASFFANNLPCPQNPSSYIFTNIERFSPSKKVTKPGLCLGSARGPVGNANICLPSEGRTSCLLASGQQCLLPAGLFLSTSVGDSNPSVSESFAIFLKNVTCLDHVFVFPFTTIKLPFLSMTHMISLLYTVMCYMSCFFWHSTLSPTLISLALK